MTQSETPPASDELGIDRRTFLRAAGALAGSIATVPLLSMDHLEAFADCDTGPVEPHVAMKETEIDHETSLLRKGSWTSMDGARLTQEGLVLTPTGSSFIDKRHNNAIVPDLSINTFGTRLRAKGDFSVNTHSQNPVVLRLYTDAPLPFDDFNYVGTPSQVGSEVQCRIVGNMLEVSTLDGVQDGTHPMPTALQTFQFQGSPTDRHLEVRREGDRLVFAVNGEQLGSIAKGAAFNTGQIWLGLNSEQGTSLVRDITTRPLNGDRLTMVETETLRVTEPLPEGLQTLVRKRRPDFLIGSAVALNPLVSDAQYAQLLGGGEFGIWTVENLLKPEHVHPEENTFTFGGADALATLAERFGIAVHGHALVYDKAEPAWMSELPYGTPAEKTHVQAVLENHIKTVVGHFKGSIHRWDVVNEFIDGFNDQASLQQNHWFKALGPEYIAIALRAAHEADPTAELWLNDFGVETNPQGRGQVLLGLVEDLRKQGVPLHGIGLQGHVNQIPRDTINPQILSQIMQEAAGLGLKVRISELDVVGDDPIAQAQQYTAVLDVCLQAPNCPSITFWGATDKTGSAAFVNNSGILVSGNKLPWTTSYRPKPAEIAMRQMLAV